MSANEDAKVWRKIAGAHLLRASFTDEEKAELEEARRDTVISSATRNSKRYERPSRAAERVGQSVSEDSHGRGRDGSNGRGDDVDAR